jgi:DNA-binding transcriptional regulator YhcF (GntR family)
MTIDQASFEPVYRQLARILREQIQVGELRPGSALPSEAALSQTFGVGRDAVRDALASLRSEGLVITTRGIGTFVREPITEVTMLRRGTGIRVAARVATADERQHLSLPEGTAVLVVTRPGQPDEVLPADRTVVEFDHEWRRCADQRTRVTRSRPPPGGPGHQLGQGDHAQPTPRSPVSLRGRLADHRHHHAAQPRGRGLLSAAREQVVLVTARRCRVRRWL